MKTLLILLTSFSLFHSVSAQQREWQPITNGARWSYGDISDLCTDHLGNLYASGLMDSITARRCVWRWDGNTWVSLPLNYPYFLGDSYQHAPLSVDQSNNVYTICMGIQDSMFVARWDGTGWNIIPGSPWGTSGMLLSVDVGWNNYLYASLQLFNPVNGNDIKIYQWDGAVWTELGNGLPNNNSYNYASVHIATDKNGLVYAAGTITALSSSNLYNIMVWDGSSWKPAANDADILYAKYEVNTLKTDTAGNVYALDNWFTMQAFPYTFVVKWDGVKWSPFLNTYAPNDFCLDDAANLYGTGSAGTYSWDGSQLNSIGNTLRYTNAGCSGGSLLLIARNDNGNLYTAGTVSDVDGRPQILTYKELQPGHLMAFAQGNTIYCNEPTAISATAVGGTPPYTYSWSDSISSGDTAWVTEKGKYRLTITDALGVEAVTGITMCRYCYSRLQGNIFNDLNNNCTYDSGDVGLNNRQINIVFSNSHNTYTTLSAYGHYSVYLNDTGAYTILVPDTGTTCTSFNTCVSPSATGYLATLGDTIAQFNISLNNYVANPDVTLHVGWSAANPGFDKEYWMLPYRVSLNEVSGPVTITFHYDPILEYVRAADPQPLVDTTAHTLTWTIDGSTVPYYTWNWLDNKLGCTFHIPATVDLAYVLSSAYTITTTVPDCDTGNNSIFIPQLVTGSFDPNEKEVYPAGPLSEADTVLTYTIHFQNTGTDSTHFVIVRDTLSPFLDPVSVRNLASSTKYSTFGTNGNIITWTFDPLHLPDSATNPEGSKGFVTFSIKTKPNLPIGTDIQNSGAIQFDYNADIITNTVSSVVGLPTGVKEVKSGIAVQIFPNPFTDIAHIVVEGINNKYDFTLYDVTGRAQLKMQNLQTSHFEIQRGKLAAGVYLYQITGTNAEAARGKVVIE